MTLIDTAEMYGDGKAEMLVGAAVGGVREKVFLVSKAYPQNASRSRLPQACEASLPRLATDRIDLYLLHWRGDVPLSETVEVMQKLVKQGKIRHWGVSNLDLGDMEELVAAGGSTFATNQILFNPIRRGPEFELLPWLEARNIPAMAYSPVEQGRLLKNPKLVTIAKARGVSSAQVALAWVLSHQNMIAIPKAGSVTHVEDNDAATSLDLTKAEISGLDEAFPPPRRRRALEML